MILSKEQINRYLRHIIMPEISGQGQKKLLEATALVYGENVNEIMPLILYLSSMGIGNIYLSLENKEGYELLFSDAIDLNNDVKIRLMANSVIKADFRIALGSSNFIKNAVKDFEIKFIPTIISVNNQWKALFKTFKDSIELYNFIELLNSSDKNGSLPFIQSLTGAISSIEGIKLCLNIGKTCNDLLFIDLYNMEFNYYENRFSAQAVDNLNKTENLYGVDYIKEKVSKAKVLIVGAGGLGSPVALALSMIGVGSLGLVDYDKVEASNLNRQILHSVSRIGMAKTESAKFLLKKINPSINISTYIENLTKDNVNEIVADYDLVVSAVDNIQTRYLLNDACYFMKIPVIEAGVLRFDGTNTTIIPDEGHCYRCLYPNLSASGMSCSETGVLGSVPGVMGFIQAAEAYKVISGIGTTLKNKILLFDGLEMEFNVINLEKNPDCPICGNNPTIKKVEDTTIKCNSVE